jgi:hypothetical protein
VIRQSAIEPASRRRKMAACGARLLELCSSWFKSIAWGESRQL